MAFLCNRTPQVRTVTSKAILIPPRASVSIICPAAILFQDNNRSTVWRTLVLFGRRGAYSGLAEGEAVIIDTAGRRERTF